MTLLSITTHLAMFLLGAAVCRWTTIRIGPKACTHLSEVLMADPDTPDDDPKPRRRVSTFLIAVIVALFLIVVVGGFQALRWQHEAAESRHQGECLSQWASSFTDYYQGRLAVSGDVRDATVVRDNATVAWQGAVGGIFTLFIVALSPDKPPQHVLEQQFSDALTAFTDASKALDKARADLAAATAVAGASDPPPVLDLDCTLKGDQ